MQASRNKLCGACVLEIGHERVFTAADAADCLAHLHNQGVGEDQIPITFALESKLSASDVQKRINKDGLFATNTKWDKNKHIQDNAAFMDRAANHTAHLNRLHTHVCQSLCQTEDDMEISVPTLDMHSLRAISKLRHPTSSFTPESLPSNLIKFTTDQMNVAIVGPHLQWLQSGPISSSQAICSLTCIVSHS